MTYISIFNHFVFLLFGFCLFLKPIFSFLVIKNFNSAAFDFFNSELSSSSVFNHSNYSAAEGFLVSRHSCIHISSFFQITRITPPTRSLTTLKEIIFLCLILVYDKSLSGFWIWQIHNHHSTIVSFAPNRK